jgi:hypothetical protein
MLERVLVRSGPCANVVEFRSDLLSRLVARRSEYASDKGQQFLQGREMRCVSRYHMLDTAYEAPRLHVCLRSKLYDKGPGYR